jgi:ACS family sodium-dependent inorganic phosphate cotransporter
VGLWSLGTVLTPSAAYLPTVGLTALCWARLLVGLGEGVGPPASAGLLTQFFDVRERARGVTLVFGGASICCVLLPSRSRLLPHSSSFASAVNLSRATVC